MRRLWGRAARPALVICAGIAVAVACGPEVGMRSYLLLRFWQPFGRSAASFVKPVPERADPYAGMAKVQGSTALDRLRAAYQDVAMVQDQRGRSLQGAMTPTEALEEARKAAAAMTEREREERDLIEAKLDLRAASADGDPARLEQVKGKLQEFLRRTRDPMWASEARGWLARVYFLMGDQTAAGKIYLEELNRTDSNLSRKTLLASLSLTYGYDGGPELVRNLESYFDKPEHAAFALSLVTNPRWNGASMDRWREERGQAPAPETGSVDWARIKALLLRHPELFGSERGAELLTDLGMRIALRAGDPQAALQIAARVPAGASVRKRPDFLWMLGSANYLAGRHAAAEAALLALIRSKEATAIRRTAAAYGLCGVHAETGNRVEQIRWALWLRGDLAGPRQGAEDVIPSEIYWTYSGFDLGMLLDIEASEQDLRAFLEKYPRVKDGRLVRYALAVRLARNERYAESATEYEKIGAVSRVARMKKLAALRAEAEAAAAGSTQRLEAEYRMAEFLAANSVRIYFNPTLWSGFQRYAFQAERDSTLSKSERERLLKAERQLKDEQEEYWRAYRLLRGVVEMAGRTKLGTKAAELAVRCLRRIETDRFGRKEELRAAEIELNRWLRKAA